MSQEPKINYPPLTVVGVEGFKSKSLDVRKLENAKLKVKDNVTVIIARCPACAEEGADHSSDHLIVYSDGRFGCVVHEKETDHRRRILQLAGWESSHRQVPFIRPFRPTLKPKGVQASVRVVGISNISSPLNPPE